MEFLNLTADKKGDIKKEFQEYDKDDNGYVTYDEAHMVLEKKLGFNNAKTRKLIKMCDTNNDGKLSYDEFVEFYFRVIDKMSQLNEVFNKFDIDKNGFITMDEAEMALKEMGFTTDEVKSLVYTHDANHDERLDYEEFVKFWNA